MLRWRDDTRSSDKWSSENWYTCNWPNAIYSSSNWFVVRPRLVTPACMGSTVDAVLRQLSNAAHLYKLVKVSYATPFRQRGSKRLSQYQRVGERPPKLQAITLFALHILRSLEFRNKAEIENCSHTKKKHLN